MTMPFVDKTLECRDCHQAFAFTVGEQEFFASKGLVNQPARCSGCRIKNRLIKDGKSLDSSTEVACHECGTITRVPFKPSGARPVYCLTCLQKQRSNLWHQSVKVKLESLRDIAMKNLLSSPSAAPRWTLSRSSPKIHFRNSLQIDSRWNVREKFIG